MRTVPRHSGEPLGSCRLIYFSPVRARSYAQRPHFTVEAWLNLGAGSVLWVDPYPSRLPRARDFLHRRALHDQGTALDSRIQVLSVPALPIEPLPGGRWLNRTCLWHGSWRRIREFAADGPTVLGIGRPAGLPLLALREIDVHASFYDAMDNFPEFHRGRSRQVMRQCERQVAEQVDLVVASSTYLADKFQRRGLPVVQVANAYPMSSLPVWQPTIKPQAVLGYIGCIGDWFDWPLVVRLARALPTMRIELVGPCMSRPPAALPENIRLLPPCSQHEATRHLRRFSAGLIPFYDNDLTAAADPIKYYEYQAFGLPVLTTRFGEMALRDNVNGVHFLDKSASLDKVVQAALARPVNARDVARFRANHDWLTRFEDSAPFESISPIQRSGDAVRLGTSRAA